VRTILLTLATERNLQHVIAWKSFKADDRSTGVPAHLADSPARAKNEAAQSAASRNGRRSKAQQAARKPKPAPRARRKSGTAADQAPS
jgi:hypothetical protein